MQLGKEARPWKEDRAINWGTDDHPYDQSAGVTSPSLLLIDRPFHHKPGDFTISSARELIVKATSSCRWNRNRKRNSTMTANSHIPCTIARSIST